MERGREKKNESSHQCRAFSGKACGGHAGDFSNGKMYILKFLIKDTVTKL